jgi:drug/metabolite transporter (DMT)-like permease
MQNRLDSSACLAPCQRLARRPAAANSRAMGERDKATLIGASAILLWSALALMTAASGTMPPFELAALTFAIGGAAGLIYAAARGKLAALKQSPVVWLVGVGGLFGYHALYFAALRAAPPAQASLVAYLWPLLIVLMSALLPGEKLQAKHVLGAALGFCGAALLLWGKFGDARPGYGLVLALGCAFTWSSYSIASRFLKATPTEAVAGFCLVTALLATICHALFETTVWPTKPSEIAAIVGLGLGPVGLAFYVWDYGVKRGDIRLLGVGAYAAPVLSTILLVLAGFAPATAALGLACAAIVGGAVIASR